MVLPEAVLSLIGQQLLINNAYGTLSSLCQCSITLYSLITPVLYRDISITSNDSYILFLSIHSSHFTNSHIRPSPLGFVRHLRITHFPSLGICSDIEAQSQQSDVIFPNVTELEFTLASCFSILWGPMQVLRTAVSENSSPAQTAISQIRSWTSLVRPKEVCFHLNDYTIFERDWSSFFRRLCFPWREYLEVINIHGSNYRLRPFLAGVLHRAFLDVQWVPYGAGMGSMVSSLVAGRKIDTDAWADILLTLVLDEQELCPKIVNEATAQGNRTSWELHYPGGLSEEILEIKTVLSEKLKLQCPDPSVLPPVTFITDAAVPCKICSDGAPITTLRAKTPIPHELG